MSDARLTNGPYGFAWGPLAVTRMAEINGRVILSITTDAGRDQALARLPHGGYGPVHADPPRRWR